MTSAIGPPVGPGAGWVSEYTFQPFSVSSVILASKVEPAAAVASIRAMRHRARSSGRWADTPAADANSRIRLGAASHTRPRFTRNIRSFYPAFFRYHAGTMTHRLMSRLPTFALVAVMLVPITGCIELDRVLSLKPDLSGQAEFRLALSFEPFARMGIMEKRKEQGKTGPITEAEIAEAAKEMSKEMANKPVDKAAAAKMLPPGITLVDITQKMDGFKIVVGVTLAFDDVKKLATLKLADPSGNPGGDNLSPFTGLEITESGGTMRLKLKPIFGAGGEGLMGDKPKAAAPTGPDSPLANVAEEFPKLLKEMLGESPEMKELLESLPKQLKETFRVEAAWPILETNATRKDARGAVWEYTLESLMKMTEAERDALTMTIVVRRK